MTREERDELQSFRQEMRTGFAHLTKSVDTVAERVQSLETTRAETNAVNVERRLTAERVAANRKIIIGLVAGVAGSIVLGLLNLAASSIR